MSSEPRPSLVITLVFDGRGGVAGRSTSMRLPLNRCGAVSSSTCASSGAFCVCVSILFPVEKRAFINGSALARVDGESVARRYCNFVARLQTGHVATRCTTELLRLQPQVLLKLPYWNFQRGKTRRCPFQLFNFAVYGASWRPFRRERSSTTSAPSAISAALRPSGSVYGTR